MNPLRRFISVLAVGVVLTGGFAAAADWNELYREPQGRGLALRFGPTRDGGAVALSFRIPYLPKGGSISLGSVRPAGKAGLKLASESTPFGGTVKGDGLEAVGGILWPGVLFRTDAAELELFGGMADAKGNSLSPRFLAWAGDGKVVVQPAEGAVNIDRMTEPWLLAWWGGRAPVGVAAFESAPAVDSAVLILLQRPAKSVEVGKGGWTLTFDGTAGSVVLMPLFGQNTPPAADTAKWVDGVPDDVLAQIRGWTKRLRRIPVRVRETCEPTENGCRMTETFEYVDIGDAWNTPKSAWALLPPIFALSKAMGGPIVVEADAKDLPWLGDFGTLCVLDGRDTVAFEVRIPQLKNYLWDIAKPWPAAAPEDRKAKIQREILVEEIDKILEANEHLAPYRNNCLRYAANWHWGNPGETIITLCWALPFLDAARAEKLKAYIRKEYETYNPLEIAWTPPGVGVRREFYDGDPAGAFAKLTTPARGKNLQNVYAVWQYAASVAGEEFAKALWPAVKKYVEDDLPGAQFAWDGGESTKQVGAPQLAGEYQNLNARLNAYIAYTRLARLAGDKEAEGFGACLLARGLAVKQAQAYYHDYLVRRNLRAGLVNFPPGIFTGGKEFHGYLLAGHAASGLGFYNMWRGSETPYVFLYDLSPEVGQFLHDHAREPVQACVGYHMWYNPGIWSNKGDRLMAQGEWFILEPWIPWTNFLGLALAVQMPPDELAHYTGETRAKLGDLYYIQRLCIVLRAYGMMENAKRD